MYLPHKRMSIPFVFYVKKKNTHVFLLYVVVGDTPYSYVTTYFFFLPQTFKNYTSKSSRDFLPFSHYTYFRSAASVRRLIWLDIEYNITREKSLRTKVLNTIIRVIIKAATS